jgi:hypothetical protein
LRLTHDEEAGKVGDYERELRAKYWAHLTGWQNRKKDFDAKKAATHKVFKEVFGTAIFNQVEDLIKAERFRAAWKRIRNRYSAAGGGQGAMSAAQNLLNSLVFRNHNTTFEDHMHKVNAAFMQYNAVDRELSERMKWYYLSQSFYKSTNKAYNDIFDYYKFQMDEEGVYQKTVDRLHSRFIELKSHDTARREKQDQEKMERLNVTVDKTSGKKREREEPEATLASTTRR